MKIKIDNIFSHFNNKIDAVIVVDISSHLRLLDVQLKPEPKIKAIKIVELPADNRDDVILASLRDFIQENKILHKTAILKPSLKSFFAKRIELPAIPKSELAEAVKLRLKSDSPIDLATAVLDFSIVREITKSDGAKIFDLICIAAPEQEVKAQVGLLKQLGLVCLAVGLLPWGYAKIISNFLKQENGQPIGIIHMENDSCYICMYKDNRLDFYRELPITINKLKDALSGTLTTSTGNVQLTAEEINKVLFEQGIPTEANQILAMLRPDLERLGQEIKRSLAYYDSQFQGGVVSKILVGGIAANIANIDTLLASESSLNVQRISLLDMDKDIAASSTEHRALSESYASFGLALGYKENINLLPYEFRTEKIEALQKVSLRWVALIGFLLLLVSYIFARAGISAYQKRLDNARLQLNILSEIKQIKQRTDEFNKFVLGIRNSDPRTGTILKAISNIANKNLFLESCILDSDAKNIILEGFVRGDDSGADVVLTQFSTNMENSSYFMQATISSVEKIGSGDSTVTKFRLSAKLQ